MADEFKNSAKVLGAIKVVNDIDQIKKKAEEQSEYARVQADEARRQTQILEEQAAREAENERRAMDGKIHEAQQRHRERLDTFLSQAEDANLSYFAANFLLFITSMEQQTISIKRAIARTQELGKSDGLDFIFLNSDPSGNQLRKFMDGKKASITNEHFMTILFHSLYECVVDPEKQFSVVLDSKVADFGAFVTNATEKLSGTLVSKFKAKTKEDGSSESSELTYNEKIWKMEQKAPIRFSLFVLFFLAGGIWSCWSGGIKGWLIGLSSLGLVTPVIRVLWNGPKSFSPEAKARIQKSIEEKVLEYSKLQLLLDVRRGLREEAAKVLPTPAEVIEVTRWLYPSSEKKAA